MTAKQTASEVLAVNATFYRAFSAGDYPTMCRLWASHWPVSCLHPGAPALEGRELVLESWRQILSESPPVTMRCDQARVHLFGATAVVTCYEANDDQPAHLAATNVFALEHDGWHLVHHHAGPLARPIQLVPLSQVN